MRRLAPLLAVALTLAVAVQAHAASVGVMHFNVTVVYSASGEARDVLPTGALLVAPFRVGWSGVVSCNVTWSNVTSGYNVTIRCRPVTVGPLVATGVMAYLFANTSVATATAAYLAGYAASARLAQLLAGRLTPVTAALNATRALATSKATVRATVERLMRGGLPSAASMRVVNGTFIVTEFVKAQPFNGTVWVSEDKPLEELLEAQLANITRRVVESIKANLTRVSVRGALGNITLLGEPEAVVRVSIQSIRFGTPLAGEPTATLSATNVPVTALASILSKVYVKLKAVLTPTNTCKQVYHVALEISTARAAGVALTRLTASYDAKGRLARLDANIVWASTVRSTPFYAAATPVLQEGSCTGIAPLPSALGSNVTVNSQMMLYITGSAPGYAGEVISLSSEQSSNSTVNPTTTRKTGAAARSSGVTVIARVVAVQRSRYHLPPAWLVALAALISFSLAAAAIIQVRVRRGRY